MKFKSALAGAAVAAALSVMSVAPAQAAGGTNVAVINLPYIMSEIPQAKDARAKIQAKFGPREEALKKLETEGKTLAEKLQSGKLSSAEATNTQRKLAQMNADFNLQVQALREDQRKAINEEDLKLAKIVQQAIDSVAKEKAIDLVLRGEGVAYTIKALDISEDVIAKVAKAGKTNSKAK